MEGWGAVISRAPIFAAVLIALSGCAARVVEFHEWPSETPAADNAAAVAKAQRLAAAAALARRKAAAPNPEIVPVTPAEAPPMKTYDPWGRLNRFTYRFNARFDEALFLPVANDYRRLPAPMRKGVHNFFANIAEIDTFLNYAAQGRLGRSVRSLGRFLVNSTLGIGGLFDPATRIDLPDAPTGFGTTLAKWGMHPGPYLVLPIYGPSTLRGGVGFAADYTTLYFIDPAWTYRGGQSWGLGVLNAVDQRAHVDFRYYSTGSPFEYEMVRFLYVRKQLIEDAGLHKHEPLPESNPNLPAGE